MLNAQFRMVMPHVYEVLPWIGTPQVGSHRVPHSSRTGGCGDSSQSDTRGGDAAVPGPRFGKRLLFRHRGLVGWLVVIGLGIGGVSAWLLNRERGLVDRKPGQVVPDFAIPDVRTDQLHSLSQHRGQVVVIVFTGTACPVGELYMPRLSVIAQAFEMRDVDFLAINSNASDTAEDVAEHARRAQVAFPGLERYRESRGRPAARGANLRGAL